MFKTRNQCNNEAIRYNPALAPLIENDPDYCIRGMGEILGLGLFCDWGDYEKILESGEKYHD